MDYRVVLTKNAKRDLDRLDGVIVKRIKKKLVYLAVSPRELSKVLVNFDQGSYRYRVGSFRVCFDIEGRDIVILRIRHRREVYR